MLPANGHQLLQHKVGLLPGNGQELALKDLKTRRAAVRQLLWKSSGWTSGGVGGLRPFKLAEGIVADKLNAAFKSREAPNAYMAIGGAVHVVGLVMAMVLGVCEYIQSIPTITWFPGRSLTHCLRLQTTLTMRRLPIRTTSSVTATQKIQARQGSRKARVSASVSALAIPTTTKILGT